MTFYYENGSGWFSIPTLFVSEFMAIIGWKW